MTVSPRHLAFVRAQEWPAGLIDPAGALVFCLERLLPSFRGMRSMNPESRGHHL